MGRRRSAVGHPAARWSRAGPAVRASRGGLEIRRSIRREAGGSRGELEAGCWGRVRVVLANCPETVNARIPA